MLNSSDPDLSGLIRVQTVCKVYHQTALVGNQLLDILLCVRAAKALERLCTCVGLSEPSLICDKNHLYQLIIATFVEQGPIS